MDSAATKINFSSHYWSSLPSYNSLQILCICILNPQSNRPQSCSQFVASNKVQIFVSSTILCAISPFHPAAGQAPVSQPGAEFFISPIFPQPLAEAVNQMKPVWAACDRISAIERLHTLAARTDECFNTYKSREGKNRARRDHSRAPCLDMLISYQFNTDKPDVEVRRIQAQKNPQPVCKHVQQGCKPEHSQRCLDPALQKFQLSKTSIMYGNWNSTPWWKNIGGSGQAQLPWFRAGRELCLVTHIP